MGTGKFAARRDLALIASTTAAAAAVCIRWDLSEALLGWTRQHESLQLDELPAVLLVLAICLIWFSWRRYFEARRELVLRRTTEAQLASALTENQRLAQQYLDMQEYERKALARDLHDELGQYLNVIKLDAVSIRDALAPPGPIRPGEACCAPPVDTATFGAAARAVIENVDRIHGVVTGLIRRLRPVGFDELGVAAAIEHCVNDWRARLPATTIDLDVDAGVGELDENRALALFRLVQEALTNVARHAGAARVAIRVALRDGSPDGHVEISIVDDGAGTDLDARHGAAGPRGLGLVGMRERVAAFGGTLSLSSRPGKGFRIEASLPVHPPAAAAGGR